MATMNIMQAAKVVGVADKTIRRAIRAGKLHASFPQPNQAIIQIEDLELFIASRQKENDVQTVTSVLLPASQPVFSPLDLQERVIELEETVQALEVRLKRVERLLPRQHMDSKPMRRLKPIELIRFAALHNIGSEDYQRAINMEALPIKKQNDGKLMLDEKGQKAFYQVFRDLPHLVKCADCPHGYV
jgi:hypothetical protein